MNEPVKCRFCGELPYSFSSRDSCKWQCLKCGASGPIMPQAKAEDAKSTDMATEVWNEMMTQSNASTADRLAIVDINAELLRQRIGFPEGTTFVSVHVAKPGTVQFCVQHADLKPVGEGQGIPTISPVFTRVDFDWGQ